MNIEQIIKENLSKAETVSLMPPPIRYVRVLLWVVSRGWFLLGAYGLLGPLIFMTGEVDLFFLDALYKAIIPDHNFFAWVFLWLAPSFFCAFILKVVDQRKNWSRFASGGVFLLAGWAFAYESMMIWAHHHNLPVGAIFLTVLFGAGAVSLFTNSAIEWFSPTKESDADSEAAPQAKIFVRLLVGFLLVGFLFLIPVIPGFVSYHQHTQRNPDLEAKQTIKNAFTAAQAFFLDHPNAVLTVPDMEDKGLVIPSDVLVEVINGNKKTFVLHTRTKDEKNYYSLDSEGNLKYSVE